MYTIPTLPLQIDLESKAVLRQLNQANKKLAELKGVALTIPNESILINTLILQEAKESSAVENIITTHDELYKADAELRSFAASASTKEVVMYADALKRGFDLIRKNKIITLGNIKEIQSVLERNKAGLEVCREHPCRINVKKSYIRRRNIRMIYRDSWTIWSYILMMTR